MFLVYICKFRLHPLKYFASIIFRRLKWETCMYCVNYILMSAGNPGVAQYYADFMQELYEKCQMPICCVSHAGHVTLPHETNQCQ